MVIMGIMLFNFYLILTGLTSASFPADVVFFVYLYQRWIYRVDPNRYNEFGTSGVARVPDGTEAADADPATAAAITEGADADADPATAAAITEGADADADPATATAAAITDKPDGEKKND